jgi:hypothetical protein
MTKEPVIRPAHIYCGTVQGEGAWALSRQPRVRGTEIKVTVTPVAATPQEYEAAWAGALEILHRLARNLGAARQKGGA